MQIIIPQLPKVKNGQMDAEELQKFLFSLQLVIKKIAEKV